jgi:hypothetical protein
MFGELFAGGEVMVSEGVWRVLDWFGGSVREHGGVKDLLRRSGGLAEISGLNWRRRWEKVVGG